ncbi:MAG: sigma-70 family RNA polymerase sigma factor, partial [Syntrophotaleaceae bacterium]
MGFDKRYEGIDEYAVQIIKYKARQLVGRVGFTESDREDLEQEMLMDLLQRLPKYNADRAQRNTFIARVVEHKIATIIEARKAGLRDYRLCNCSLNDRLEDEEGGSVERMETIDQEDYL